MTAESTGVHSKKTRNINKLHQRVMHHIQNLPKRSICNDIKEMLEMKSFVTDSNNLVAPKPQTTTYTLQKFEALASCLTLKDRCCFLSFGQGCMERVCSQFLKTFLGLVLFNEIYPGM